MSETLQLDVFSENRLKHLIEDVLAEAKRQGATSAEVDVAVNKGFSVMVRMGDVETIEYNQDKIIGITVYFGKRSGSASLCDLRPEAIKSAVTAACNIAKFTDEDPFSGLADKEFLAKDFALPDIYYPWDISVAEAIDLGKQCEALALSQDKRITNSEGVSIATLEVIHGYGNSLGFIGVCPVTRHEISCVLIAKDHEDMQRDYSYSISCDAKELKSLDYLASQAVKHTVNRLGGRRIPTCKVPVIFNAEESRSLLSHFIGAIQGGNIYRKASFLVDHVGKQIFPAHIKIDERPYLAKSLGSTPFDDDGVATRNNVFVEDGILQKYSLGTYSARKLGMETTGNAGGMHNVFITTGKLDASGLIKKMHKGLLVTELMGSGVNTLTGDYSRGAAGYWVEHGEIQYPVQEITIAGKLQSMYANLVEVGTDVDNRGNIQTGSIMLEEMIVAGE